MTKRATAKNGTHTATFSKFKETKGTHVFSEDDENPIIGTLYLKKSAVAGLGNPERIEVTVKALKS